jgi:hypothetical protein
MIPTDLLAHISGRMASIVATETVDIYRQVTDSDGMGGITVSWRRVGHDIPGAKTYNSGDHSQVGGGLLQEGEWTWALPIGTDIRTSDEIRTDDIAWTVIGTDSHRSQPLMLTVRCNLAQDGRA